MADSVTTYRMMTIEPEDYRRDKVSAHQRAKLNSVIYGTPDPDIEEHVVTDGTTIVYINEVQSDGTVIRKEL